VLLEAGGLHVIMSYMPSNLRVEEQGFGRSGRSGNKGSGQMIVYYSLNDNLNIVSNASMINALEYLREERDMREEQRLQEIRIKMIPRVMLERELFEKFETLQSNIKKHFTKEKVTDQVFCLNKDLHIFISRLY
jgi:golgin subfamily B member 1